MRKLSFLFACLLGGYLSFCQNPVSSSFLYGHASLGLPRLVPESENAVSFPEMQFSDALFGFGFQKNVSRWQFDLRLSGGVQSSVQNQILFNTTPNALSSYGLAIRETYQKRFPVIEIPVSIGFSVFQNRVWLKSGLFFRQLLNQQASSIDFHPRPSACFGYSMGVWYKVDRFFLGIDYMAGLTQLHQAFSIQAAEAFGTRFHSLRFSFTFDLIRVKERKNV